MSPPPEGSIALRVLRWILRRRALRITREQAIAIATREYDPSGKFEWGQYAAREHLGHWEVQVRSRYLVGPLLATIEIDGTTGDVLSSVFQDL